MKRTAQFLLAASTMAILAVSIGACGGGDDNNSTTAAATTTSTTSTEPTVVNASLGEYFIKLDKSSVPAGRVQFNASNDGKLEHELVVIRTNLAPGKLPLKNGEADESVGSSPGEISSLPSGTKKALDVKLSSGKYVLICNLPGHYKAGQYTGLSVK